jgi:hypothetical protein
MPAAGRMICCFRSMLPDFKRPDLPLAVIVCGLLDVPRAQFTGS